MLMDILYQAQTVFSLWLGSTGHWVQAGGWRADLSWRQQWKEGNNPGGASVYPEVCKVDFVWQNCLDVPLSLSMRIYLTRLHSYMHLSTLAGMLLLELLTQLCVSLSSLALCSVHWHFQSWFYDILILPPWKPTLHGSSGNAISIIWGLLTQTVFTNDGKMALLCQMT